MFIPQTPELLVVDFVVVGGGISGLTAAIALARAGHRVTMLDQRNDFMRTRLAGGCRLVPNMTRLLSRWGLEDELREVARVQQYVCFTRCETGEVAARGEWAADFETESGGVFLGMHYADFRRILYEAAVKHGARIRGDARVTAVSLDEDRRSVTLETGEELVADVVIGADGMHSISRSLMVANDEMTFTGPVIYNAVVPVDEMATNPDLAVFLPKEGLGTTWSWSGEKCGAMGFSIKRDEFHLHIYVHSNKPIQYPIMGSSKEELLAAMERCEPRLIKMVEISTDVVAIPIVDKPELEDWVHDCGRFLVIGEAAHPLTTGSLYAISVAAGDGMTLGRLFSHLHRRAQIRSFLVALAESRQRRVRAIKRAQSTNPAAMAMPPGILQTKTLAAVVDAMGNEEAARYTEEAIREIFVFDPEEEADDWWVQWGLVQERASRVLSGTAHAHGISLSHFRESAGADI